MAWGLELYSYLAIRSVIRYVLTFPGMVPFRELGMPNDNSEYYVCV